MQRNKHKRLEYAGVCLHHETLLVVAARLVGLKKLELLGVDGTTAFLAHQIHCIRGFHAQLYQRKYHQDRSPIARDARDG